MYASQLVSVSAFTGFEYDIAVDDFEPFYRLSARYYGHSEDQPTVGTLSGDTHDAQVEAVSDVGFIYRDEGGALQLATPPLSSEARWTYHALAGLAPDQTDAFQVKSGAYEALYGAHDSGASHDLYQLTMNGAAPERFELVRRFAEPISKLTDHHMITREEERGVWVRHRLPACTDTPFKKATHVQTPCPAAARRRSRPVPPQKVQTCIRVDLWHPQPSTRIS